VNRYAAEIFGTFVMVFCGTGAIVIDAVTNGGVGHVGVAITFGLVVMALIYALGDVSGAHMNPAVTFGFWVSRRLPGRCVPAYMLSQIAGGLGASALLRMMFSNRAYLGASLPAGSAAQSFALETVLTFMLMFVILCVSTGPKEVGVMAGIAVGGVVGLEAMFAGPICGASMNPVRSLAPALVSGHLQYVWIYLLAPFLGAAVAVPCWRLTRGSIGRKRPAVEVVELEEVQHVEH
jgi:aquaporin NIP